MSSERDPYDTVERLTNALESIAKGSGSVVERANNASFTISPLQESEFPETSRHMYEFIVNNQNTDDPVVAGQVVQTVWNLYWEMTENIRYR